MADPEQIFLKKGRLPFAALGVLPLLLPAAARGGEPARYRSPFDLAAAPDGRTAFVSDRTAGSLLILDLEELKVTREIPLSGEPTGLALAPGGDRLYVSEYGAGTVAEIDARAGRVLRRLPVGLRPMGLALAPRRARLLACNTVTDDVSIVDLASGKEAARIRVPREPFFAAVAPGERTALVGNLLPATPASDPASSAAVSVLDLEENRDLADLRLPPGSTSLREICIDPAGRRAYVAHTIGRFQLPATQLERGWIYTNGLSVIDLAARRVQATLLLDQPQEGAGNPWGLQLSADGSELWVSLRGVHQAARLDLSKLEPLLAAGPRPLIDDLGALSRADALRRYPVFGLGPRGLALTPDGKTLLIACYHSGEVALLDTATGGIRGRISLGPEPPPDPARRGEILFHDATVSFQHWMSCSSCHPDEGRTDGLRWDLLNDGLGTPQRTRSLLWSHLTRPTTARGVRPGYEASVPMGFHFLGVVGRALEVDAVKAYLQSLRPEPSPFLTPEGKLGEAAERGRLLFEGQAGCSACHQGSLRSDQKPHDVGTAGELDQPGERFYTKRLVELYRTAPFLHDGRAGSLREVFERFNPRKLHGKYHRLTGAEREDLISFLLSL
jgi:DNA-binding beta-propeller fold protein YncE